MPNIKSDIILTIVIPTYNRSTHISKLLRNLEEQITGHENQIKVLILDNCSNDCTESEVKKFLKLNNYSYIRNKSNIGPDGNFLKGYKNVTSNYFWFIGDDDLPRKGLIKLLINFLLENSPSLIYLPSLWDKNIESNRLNKLFTLDFCQYDLKIFAQKTHVFSTFISSWIINKSELPQSSEKIESLKNTNFIQLGWILPLYNQNSKLYIVNRKVILASKGNTRGGYELINTFGYKFPKIVKNFQIIDKLVADIILKSFIKSFLPKLILGKKIGLYKDKISHKKISYDLFDYLKGYPEFWFYCLPIIFVPEIITSNLYKIYCKFAKILSINKH